MKNVARLIAIGLFLTLACNTLGLGGSTATPTADRAATVEALSLEETQAAEEAQLTKEAEATQVAMEEATSAAAMAATQTVERDIRDKTATAVFEERATAQAQPLADLVEELRDEGYVYADVGTYYPLDDFDESWAMINFFDAWRTDYAPADFVLNADISWDSASDTANWFNSGCGFIFRSNRNSSGFYVVFLTLDGYVNLQHWNDAGPRSLGFSYYGRLDLPDGNANMTLVAEGSSIRVFINDRLVHSRIDTKLESGELAYTLLSGTNAGFGTRCIFENVGLWELESD